MPFELPTSVSQIMTTDVVSVEEADFLSNLLESMQALRFRHLPVTDGDRLIGLVTERDLLRLSTSNLWPHRAQQDQALFTRFRVRDVMLRDIVTVAPETPLAAAGKLMLAKRLGCLPVVNDANQLVGIVTSSDFVAAVTKAGESR